MIICTSKFHSPVQQLPRNPVVPPTGTETALRPDIFNFLLPVAAFGVCWYAVQRERVR